jgi:hypothetical protein
MSGLSNAWARRVRARAGYPANRRPLPTALFLVLAQRMATCRLNVSVYIGCARVNSASAECVALGGSIVSGPREAGGGMFCVIRDPAGAVCALFAPPA